MALRAVPLVLLFGLLASCGDKSADTGGGGDGSGETCADPQTWYLDGDSDGYGDIDGTAKEACERPATAWVNDNSDCDDTDYSIDTGATETCSAEDDDCDGLVDDDDDSVDPATFRDWYADEDGDGYGDPDSLVQACVRPEGLITDYGDCDDDDYDINPAVSEDCEDGVDNNCDGYVDAEDTEDCREGGGGGG